MKNKKRLFAKKDLTPPKRTYCKYYTNKYKKNQTNLSLLFSTKLDLVEGFDSCFWQKSSIIVKKVVSFAILCILFILLLDC